MLIAQWEHLHQQTILLRAVARLDLMDAIQQPFLHVHLAMTVLLIPMHPGVVVTLKQAFFFKEPTKLD